MGKVKLAVLSNCEVISERIKNILKDTDEFNCVFVSQTDKETLDMAKKHKPDVLVLNASEKDGFKILPKLSEVCPKLKVVVLTKELDESSVISSFAVGAENYVTESMTDKEILSVIESTCHGKNSIRPEIAQILAQNSIKMRSSLLYLINILVRLSPSEFEVLKNIYDGMSYTEIAKTRYVSVSTVKNQVLRVLKKFKVHSMKDLVEELRSLRIFDLIPDQQFKKEKQIPEK